MKIIYTPSAEHELENYFKRQKAVLEKLIVERKGVFGDEIVEITATDIKNAAHRSRLFGRPTTVLASGRFVSRLYVLGGAALMLAAVYFEEIRVAIKVNPTQVIMFCTGAFIATVGMWFNGFVRARQKSFEEARRSLEVKEEIHQGEVFIMADEVTIESKEERDALMRR